MKLPGRRRRFLIDRLQYQLLGIHLLYLSIVIFMFVAAVFLPAIVELFRPQNVETQAQAASEFLTLHRRIWPAIPISLLLICVHSILFSHRIAGPLYRFRNVLRAVAGGDLSVRAGVRDKDFLRRDSDAINEAIVGVARRVRQSKAQLVRAQEVQQQLAHCLAETDLSGARHAGSELEGELARLGKILGELETGKQVDAATQLAAPVSQATVAGRARSSADSI